MQKKTKRLEPPRSEEEKDKKRETRRIPENPYPDRKIPDPIKPKSIIYADSRVYTLSSKNKYKHTIKTKKNPQKATNFDVVSY